MLVMFNYNCPRSGALEVKAYYKIKNNTLIMSDLKLYSIDNKRPYSLHEITPQEFHRIKRTMEIKALTCGF